MLEFHMLFCYSSGMLTIGSEKKLKWIKQRENGMGSTRLPYIGIEYIFCDVNSLLV